MLRSAKELKGLTVRGTDGDVGHVDDFYFDDEKWVIRYIVVQTGGWLGKRVLISPVSFNGLDWNRRAIDLSLTRDRIRNSPDADLTVPVSRQYERAYAGYYGYGPYWGGAGFWGMGGVPAALYPAAREGAERSTAPAPHDSPMPHIRSSEAALGDHIEAVDGGIGHVDDLIVDDTNWAIRYLNVDTSNWIGGTPVLIPRRALREADWLRAKIRVSLTKEQVQDSPRYDPAMLAREDEHALDSDYR